MKNFYSILFILLSFSCNKITNQKTVRKKEILNHPKLNDKTSSIEKEKTFQKIKPIESIALNFINSYVENCNKMREQIGIIEWVNSNPNSSEKFKFELNKIMEKAEIENPGYRLGFDPIFDAQDFPYKGFELVNSNSEKGIVTVRDKILKGFEMEIKLVFEKNRWLIDGVRIINNNYKKVIDYKWVKKYTINGEYIGDLYVNTINDTIFNSLRIINKLDTIYKINKLEFWNKNGEDFKIPKNYSQFYGYSFALIDEESFVLNSYSNEGKNIGDNLTIIWNESSKIFEIMITP